MKDKLYCQLCKEELIDPEIEEYNIETINCIFYFCTKCNSEIESMIENSLEYYANGERI